MRCIKDGAVIPENDEDAVELQGNAGICGKHYDELMNRKPQTVEIQRKTKGRRMFSDSLGRFAPKQD